MYPTESHDPCQRQLYLWGAIKYFFILQYILDHWWKLHNMVTQIKRFDGLTYKPPLFNDLSNNNTGLLGHDVNNIWSPIAKIKAGGGIIYSTNTCNGTSYQVLKVVKTWLVENLQYKKIDNSYNIRRRRCLKSTKRITFSWHFKWISSCTEVGLFGRTMSILWPLPR